MLLFPHLMTPESIVTSLELSRKLKDAGYWESTAHWWIYPNEKHPDWPSKPFLITEFERDHYHQEEDVYDQLIAAPTAEEILRKLPDSVDTDIDVEILGMGRNDDGNWIVWYSCDDTTHNQTPVRIENSLANAAAAMYCYLAEQKLLPSP